jgi:hypothetical protein
MDPGEGGFYDPKDGLQVLYHRNRNDGADGFYMVTCDVQGGQGERQIDGRAQQQQNRFISLRHVNKKKQQRPPPKQQQGGGGGAGGQAAGGQQRQRYKHEGDSVNTEQRLTSAQIQYYDGSTKVGHYDKGGKDWLHHDGQGATHSMRADQKHSHIKHGGNHIWVDDGDCKASKPIIIEPDNCS